MIPQSGHTSLPRWGSWWGVGVGGGSKHKQYQTDNKHTDVYCGIMKKDDKKLTWRKVQRKTENKQESSQPPSRKWVLKPLDPNGTIIIMFWWKAGSLPGHNGRVSLVQKIDFWNEDNSPKAPFWKSQRSKMPPKSNFPVQIGAGTLSKQSLGAISKEHETSMTLWLEAECF